MSRHLHPIEALILAAMAVFWAARELLVALVALLLTIARWRPAAAPPVALQQPSPPPPARPWLPPCWAALEALPVVELRRIALTLNLNLPRTITRNGRRADLLEAFAPEPVGALLLWQMSGFVYGFPPMPSRHAKGYINNHLLLSRARQPLTGAYSTHPTSLEKWQSWTPRCGLMSACRSILHKICKTLNKQLAFLAVKSSAVLWLFTNEQKKPSLQEAM